MEELAKSDALELLKNFSNEIDRTNPKITFIDNASCERIKERLSPMIRQFITAENDLKDAKRDFKTWDSKRISGL